MEFLKGSADDTVFTDKVDYVERLKREGGMVVLPTYNTQLKERFYEIIKLFKSNSGKKSKSLADLFLAAAQIHYQNSQNIFIVTEDTNDFEAEFFTREIIFNIVNKEMIKPIIFCKLITTS